MAKKQNTQDSVVSKYGDANHAPQFSHFPIEKRKFFIKFNFIKFFRKLSPRKNIDKFLGWVTPFTHYSCVRVNNRKDLN
jgi:hypothetical protein